MEEQQSPFTCMAGNSEHFSASGSLSNAAVCLVAEPVLVTASGRSDSDQVAEGR